MKRGLPSITIIVATYNAERTLQRCIDAVSSQRYKKKELIIIDGGSTDGTVSIIKRNRSKIAFWISEKDRGVYDAWNKGVERASGDWIYFLGSDDVFYDDTVLERAAESLVESYPEFRIVYGNVVLVNSAGEEVLSVGGEWETLRRKFFDVMSLPHQGVFHHRQFFIDNGTFDSSFSIAGDYDLLLKELSHRSAKYMHGMIVARMETGGLSSTPENGVRILNELRRAQKKNGIRFPGFYWMFARLRVWIRQRLWTLLGETTTRNLLDFARRVAGLQGYWKKG